MYLKFLLHFWSYNNSLKITVQPIDCSTLFDFILSNFMCLAFSTLSSSSLGKIVTIFLRLEKAV